MRTPAFLQSALGRVKALPAQARAVPQQAWSKAKQMMHRRTPTPPVVPAAPAPAAASLDAVLTAPRSPGTHGIWGGNARAAKAAQALSAAYGQNQPAVATAVAEPPPATTVAKADTAAAVSANSLDLVEALKAMGIAAQPVTPGGQANSGHGVWDGKNGVPLFLVVPEDFIAASRQAMEQRRARPYIPRRRRSKTAQERLDRQAEQGVTESVENTQTNPATEIAPEDVATVDEVAEVHEKVAEVSERLQDLEALLAAHPLPPAAPPMEAVAPVVAPAAATAAPPFVPEVVAPAAQAAEPEPEPVQPQAVAPVAEEPAEEAEMVRRYRPAQEEPKHVFAATPAPKAQPAPAAAAEDDEDDGLRISAVPSAKTKPAEAPRTKIVLVDEPVIDRPKPKREPEAKKPEPKKETKPAPEPEPMDIIYKPRPTRKVSAFQEFTASLKYFGLGAQRSAFVQNLATMLDAGLPLVDALRTLMKETKVKAMRSIVQEIVDSVETGSPLWRAMDDLHFFSPHAIALVRIGEEAGNMAQNMVYLAEQQEKDANLKGKVQMAMIYPSIVLTLMFFIVVGLGMFVLPQLISVLFSLNAKLPVVTLWVIAFTNFFTGYGHIAVPAFLFSVFLYATLSKFTRLKVVTQWVVFHIPGVGKLMRQATIARFGVIVGGLMQAGVPLVDAMISLVEVTPVVSYKKFYQKLLDHICNGDTFSKSFAAIRGSDKLLPSSMQQLIITGERSGALAKIMVKISEIYEKEANHTAEKLPVILEPIILLVIGGLVGTIAFAIIIPIYSVVGNIGH